MRKLDGYKGWVRSQSGLCTTDESYWYRSALVGMPQTEQQICAPAAEGRDLQVQGASRPPPQVRLPPPCAWLAPACWGGAPLLSATPASIPLLCSLISKCKRPVHGEGEC